MAWSGTVDDAHKIDERLRAVRDNVVLTDGRTGTVVGSVERVLMVKTERWVGIEGTAAFDFVAAYSTIGTIQDVNAQRANDAGGYTVTMDTVTPGDWA